MKPIKLVAVVGPTASGKTALAIDIAKKFSGEIVSCDSMQLYDFAPIATAAPTDREKAAAPHHLIGILRAGESYSVSKYAKAARRVINDISERGHLSILCGGTGLYYSAVVDNIKFLEDGFDPRIRNDLLKRAEREGLYSLYDELCKIDPVSAKKIEKNDKKRILRGLEIFYSTGKTLSEQTALSRAEPSPYELFAIGITYRDRQKLYDRINLRVDKMIEQGLIDEAYEIFKKNPAGTGMQAIGVKELYPYFRKEVSLEQAVETIKMESRRYAKRQLTWFRRDERIHWIYADEAGLKNIFENIEIPIEKFVKT